MEVETKSKIRIFKKTKQKLFNKVIFGFDIETCNKNKDFVMASIYNENYQKFFYSTEECIKEIKTNKIFHNSVIFATNLAFDFFGMFFNNIEIGNFKTLFRGSSLIKAQTYYKITKNNTEFYPHYRNRQSKSKKYLPSLLFLDTMNYAMLSVKKMGDIVNIPKLVQPEFLGEKPKNYNEWEQMKDYNLQDSKISYFFMKFFINSIEKLGGTFKNTIASTSMSVFRNKYLKDDYILPTDDNILLEEFKSYFGGRTEAFKRGKISNMFYYDFNSLYPSVMHDYELPDPSSVAITHKNTTEYINKYHGISEIEIYIPENIKFPILPLRYNNKVMFITGCFRGFYTHIEIREAIKQGGIINMVHKTLYYTKTCTPFNEFTDELYNLRCKFKQDNNKFEYVIKIILNSLYGKFGQRFTNIDNWVHECSISNSELLKYDNIERKGCFIKITQDKIKPAVFCIPIWASYITAYARLKLHSVLEINDAVYCDTDSIITKNKLINETHLGGLKLEMEIKEGIIVRPKFYAIKNNNSEEEYVKIKGLGKRLCYLKFKILLDNPSINYDKFTKFKESLRYNLIPNEIITITKEFSLEDTKRLWTDKFDYNVLENSLPFSMELLKEIKFREKANYMYEKEQEKLIKELYETDKFDIEMVGNDITTEEFIENEMFFAEME